MQHDMKAVEVATAILPVAGPGTRFLPATRTVSHALLPVIDTPLIQFALDEARLAGARRIVIVTRPQDTALRDYVASCAQPEGVEVVFALQLEGSGLGHAVLQAAPHALPGPVSIILPDDLILGPPCLPGLVRLYQRSGAGHLVAVAEVARGAVPSYAVLDPLGPAVGAAVRAVGIVEKPAPEDAPSRLAIAGRYVLHPRLFADLAAVCCGRGRSDLTRAIARGIDRVGLAGARVEGDWHDCGTPHGLLDAALALRRQREIGTMLKIAAE